MMSRLRSWALALSMIAGASVYLVGSCLPMPAVVRQGLLSAASGLQPVLIFLMLLLTFCRVRFADMRLRGWQLWLLFFQSACYGLFCLLCCMTDDYLLRLSFQSALVCFICPTATAAAVVTDRLGGNPGTLTAYTILINLCASVLIPLGLPLVHDVAGGVSFFHAFLLIVRRVFPLLIFPLLTATLLRRFLPGLVQKVARYKDLPFRLWIVALALAICFTTRTIMHARPSVEVCLGIAIASSVACAAQFAFGRWIGMRYDDAISAGQACGQKNTILAIWVGLTFLDPLTALAGGFYSIWHNVYNSWQLSRVFKAVSKEAPTDVGCRTLTADSR